MTAARDVKQRFGTLKDERIEFDNHWQEVSDSSLGRRDFTVFERPGRQRHTRIYDTTAMDANNLLAAALHSLLTNPQTDWWDLRFVDTDLNLDPEARAYLEDVHRRVKLAFTRAQSGFASQIAMVWEDLPGFGNACMYIEEDFAFGARFIARPISEIWIDTDEAGWITAVYRKFTLEPWQAVARYGEERLSGKIIDAANKPTNTKKFDFLQVVRQRGSALPGRIDAAGMPFESLTMEFESADVVSERGYRTNPFLYTRWSVDPGEKYGRGPGMSSSPNQKMLNAMWRTYIRGSEKAVDPPVLVDNDSVVGGTRVQITPGRELVVHPSLGPTNRDPIRYLENRAQPQWAHEIMESRARKVEKAFHAEIIQAFMDPRMTATQVLEIAQLTQRQLSPMLGRNQQELLDPMIARVLDIESRRSDFPRAPEWLEEAEFKIEYVGPVARAQRAAESQAVVDTWASLQPIAQIDPSVLDGFDPDEAARVIAEGNGIPARVMRLPDEVAAIRQNREAQKQQEQLEQTINDRGTTISKLLPGIAKLNEQPGGALPN